VRIPWRDFGLWSSGTGNKRSFLALRHRRGKRRHRLASFARPFLGLSYSRLAPKLRKRREESISFGLTLSVARLAARSIRPETTSTSKRVTPNPEFMRQIAQAASRRVEVH
jgi:hypothetical protein